MNNIQKRFFLYLFGCITIRSLLVYIAKTADKTKLKIIFCMGETLSQKKKNQSLAVLKKQIIGSVSRKINFNNIIFAYEPVWSIGTGLVPSSEYLEKIFLFLNNYLKKNFKIKSPNILYGGSVNAVNIKDLRSIKACSG